MTPRIQAMVAALAVLLVGMGAVLVLVGDAGVQNSVYSAENTATPLPTDIPDIALSDWVPSETSPGEWEYQQDGTTVARLRQETLDLETLTASYSPTPLPEDTPLPALELLNQLRILHEQQLGPLEDNELLTFEGPQVELVNGVPMAIAHITYQAGILQQYPEGIDTAIAIIDLGNGEYNHIQYMHEGPRDDRLYEGFMAWLTENAPDLATPEAADDESSDETSDNTADATPETAADEPSDTADTIDATPEAADETSDTADTADATPETAADEPSDTTDTADATPEPTTEPVSENPADSGEATTDVVPDTWVEMAPGQLIYTVNADAQATIIHGPGSRAILLTNLGFDPASEDAPSTLEDLLNALKTNIEASIEAEGMVVNEDAAVEGPVFSSVSDIPLAYIILHVEASTDASGQAIPSQTIYQYLIDLGESDLYSIRFSYLGEDPVLENGFQAWLVENVSTFAETTAPAE